MEWLVPVIALIFLFIFLIYLLSRKDRSVEINTLIPLVLSLLVYHFGDLGLWAGWQYELVRRVASVGFYFIVPFMLLIMYHLLPKEKRGWFSKLFSLIMLIPWVYALIVLYKTPLVYLGKADDENFIYLLVISFIIAFIFIIINSYRAVKFHTVEFNKKFSRNFGTSLIILLVSYLLLWGSIDAFGYDATYLFGFANIIWALIIWCTLSKEKKVEEIKTE